MSTLKMLRAAILLVYMFGAIALSQNDTVVVRDDVATFVLRDGGTVWDIWKQHGAVPWQTFYDASATLNPEEAADRFTSVPIGAPISIPTSVLLASFVDSLFVEELGTTIEASDALTLSGQIENLGVAVLSQSDSIQDVSTAVETLIVAVGSLDTTLSENAPLVVSTFESTFNTTWVPLLLLTLGILAVIALITIAVVLVVYLRRYTDSESKMRALVREFPRYRTAEPKTSNEAGSGCERRLRQENKELHDKMLQLTADLAKARDQNEILKAEKTQLEEGILSITGHEPKTNGGKEVRQGDRRGTHGRGRPYKHAVTEP